MGWIRNNLTRSFDQMRTALYTDYGLFNLLSNNAGDFASGLTAMGEALHTVEDSYAPGHVSRDPSLHNLITAIHTGITTTRRPTATGPDTTPWTTRKPPCRAPTSPVLRRRPPNSSSAFCRTWTATRRSGPTWRGGSRAGFTWALGARVLPPYHPTPGSGVPA